MKDADPVTIPARPAVDLHQAPRVASHHGIGPGGPDVLQLAAQDGADAEWCRQIAALATKAMERVLA